MPKERFDATSNLTDVCNALTDCLAAINRLKHDLETERDDAERLESILAQRFAGTFPALTGEEMLRKIEADVKRSVTRVVADRKRRNCTTAITKQDAIDGAYVVIAKYHLNELTKNMREFIDETIDEVYVLRKPSFESRVRARRKRTRNSPAT
jgi:hypothetical protein